MISILSSLVFVSSVVLADGEELPKVQIIDAPITKVYAPMGFDDNDNVQFVIEGEFPSACYSAGPVQFKVDLDEHIIYFYISAFKSSNSCLKVRSRYLKVVDLGVLPQGEYKIVNSKKQDVGLANLLIREAGTSNIDDFLYAPVESVYLREDAQGNRRLLILHGEFTNTCMQWSKAPFIPERTSKDIILILPKVESTLERMEGEPPCRDALVPFFKTIVLPLEIPEGKYLFHIRTMNGNSINKIDVIKDRDHAN